MLTIEPVPLHHRATLNRCYLKLSYRHFISHRLILTQVGRRFFRAITRCKSHFIQSRTPKTYSFFTLATTMSSVSTFHIRSFPIPSNSSLATPLASAKRKMFTFSQIRICRETDRREMGVRGGTDVCT